MVAPHKFYQTHSDIVTVLETKRLRETVMMTVIVIKHIDGGHWRWRIDDDDNP